MRGAVIEPIHVFSETPLFFDHAPLSLPITSVYAGLLALLYLVLAARVISVRRSQNINLGDGGDKAMMRRIRAHANCAEYMPLGIILLALAEIQGAPGIALNVLGLCLLGGRILHGVALSREGPWPLGRIAGMILTFSMIAVAALGLLAHSLL